MRHILRKYPEVSFAQSWFKCIPAGRYLTLVDIFMLSMMFKKLKLYFCGYVFRKVIGAHSIVIQFIGLILIEVAKWRVLGAFVDLCFLTFGIVFIFYGGQSKALR
jgi:hypothetical protein